MEKINEGLQAWKSEQQFVCSKIAIRLLSTGLIPKEVEGIDEGVKVICEKVKQLQSECLRYREALEKIANKNDETCLQTVKCAQYVALEALKSKEEGSK